MAEKGSWGVFLVLILFNYVLFHYKVLSNKSFFQPIPSSRRTSVFILFTIMGLVGLQHGDYLSYAEEVREIARASAPFKITHLEVQYEQLARFVHGNYILWRLVIFGGQFAILFYYLKKTDLYSYGFLYIYSVLCLRSMVIGRATWGIVLFFCSTYYAIQSKNYKHLLVSPLCLFSHTSLIVLIAILPLVFLRLNKKSVFLFVALYFVLSFVLYYAFNNISMFDTYEQTEMIGQRLESYSNPNRENSIGFFGNSLGSQLSNLPRRLGLLILLIILFSKAYRNKNYIEHAIQFLLLASLFLVMFSFVMLKGNFGAGTLSYRFFDMIHLPLTIVLYNMYKQELIAGKLFQLFMGIFIFSLEVSLIMPLYYNSL